MSKQPLNSTPGTGPSGNPPEELALGFPEAADALLGEAAPLSDDNPTIISKNAPPTAGYLPTPPGFLTGSLRGRRLAHFELIEPIGVGGMAAVLRARDTQLDRFVALKILPPEMAGEGENVKRFHQEARAAAKLDHENIARVFFCGEDQRLQFIAFEFVEGENLRTVLERRGKLNVTEAIHYMLQIASGLAHAASRGVVHRDIKPSNIIITPTGRAKLVDMGLARSQQPQGSPDLTQSGVTLGTFDYISPEQALEPRDADVRSDIYSLGCTFYHALTGQPPVPEGTAARKLHCHQHVAPIDPRQLNPAIPDSVAAILARMMAKDHKDRYQGCEHLVQHLLQVANQLGAPVEVPDGVLFVDAPLPSPPRPRAGLLAALAGGGLLALLVLLSFAPVDSPPSSGGSVAAPTNQPFQGAALETGVKAPVIPIVSPAPLDDPVLVRSEAELAAALTSKQEKVHIKLESMIPLSKGGHVFGRYREQKALIIEGVPGTKAGLSFSSSQDKLYPEVWAGLIIEGGQATLRNLHLKVSAETTPQSLLSSVLVRRSSQVDFHNCQFSQVAPVEAFITNKQRTPLASIAVSNPAAAERMKPTVKCSGCLFVRGQSAVALTGVADVTANNCAFGPHGALVHLFGDSKDYESQLALTRCSAFVISGPVLRLDEGATCTARFAYSVFSRPVSGEEVEPQTPPDFPNLITQTDGERLAVRYTGVRNCYHNLNNLFGLPGLPKFPDWDVLAKDYRWSRDQMDPTSVFLKDAQPSPWQADNPLELLDTEARLAFQLKLNLADVRTDNKKQLLGVEECVWGRTYQGVIPDLTPPTQPGALARKTEKIVDPTANTGGGVYRTLEGALFEALSGDTILIKHTGLLPIQQIRLNSDRNVITVRPYQDHRPILTLASNVRDREAALFWLQRGQVKFERLAFHLEAQTAGFIAQSIIGLQGPGQCSFKDCLVTFQPTLEYRTDLRLVTLTEVKDGLNTPSLEPRLSPRVQLQDCFLRGAGDVLQVAFNKPFELELDNSLLVLDGGLLQSTGTLTEMSQDTAGSLVKLTRSTAYLTEHLIRLTDRKSGKGLIFTRVDATGCLFAAASSKPLIHCEGLDSKEQVMRVFEWKGERNAYCGFENVLDQQPSAASSMPALRYDNTKWQMFFAREADPEPTFIAGRLFDYEPGGEHPFTELAPGDLRARNEKVQGYGANVEQLQVRYNTLKSSPRRIVTPGGGEE